MSLRLRMDEDVVEGDNKLHRQTCRQAPSNSTHRARGSRVTVDFPGGPHTTAAELTEMVCQICKPMVTVIGYSPDDPPGVDSPDWPCRTNPRDDTPDRLVAALYVLARDHVAPGDLEQVLLQIRDHMPEWRNATYSNPHLHAMAQAHGAYLIAELPLVPVEQRQFVGGVANPHTYSDAIRKLAADLDRYHDGGHDDMLRAVGVELIALGEAIRDKDPA